MHFLLLLLCTVVSMQSRSVASLRNGVALTPPMGWSSWNTFECDYNETVIQSMADLLVSTGMAAAGYHFVNIDDCWEARERTKDGLLTFNATKFPSGMSALSSYVHSLNLSLGLYTSSGPLTCRGFPGSWRYEEVDAETFAGWGVDFLKLDACATTNTTARRTAYTAMSKALVDTGRRIVFSCDTDELLRADDSEEWPSEWAPSICNMGRIHGDMDDFWYVTLDEINAAANVMHTSQPGYWNDLDMMTIGMGGQSLDEYRSQFQLWCVLSSPLIAGNDLRNMSADVLNILIHHEAIAINQDRLAVSGNVIRRSVDGTVEAWARRLSVSNSSTVVDALSYHAVVLLNRASYAQNATLYFGDLFAHHDGTGPKEPWYGKVRDAWNGVELGVFVNNFTTTSIPSHGSELLTVHLVTSLSAAEPMGTVSSEM